MAAVTPTAQAAGPRSMSATLALTGATDTVSNAALVAACAPGPLKTLLSATYADVPAFLAAMAAEGFLCVFTTGTAAITSYVWVVSASTPSLSIVTGSAATAAVRMSLGWSGSN